MKKGMPLALLWLALAAHASHAQSTAEIAAWNLAGFNAIPRERAATFAEIIALLDPEIIALVEVNPDFIPGEIVAELNERDRCYERTILDQRARQNIAVLHKCDVSVSNPRFIPDSDGGNSSLRQALAVDVKIGAFDFTLIAVHLKAGRGSSERATRTRQCGAIRRFVQAVTEGEEQDVLIVGDYNMIPAKDGANFRAMNFRSFLRFVTTEDLPADAFSHISKSGNPGGLLDGFAISTDHTGEYVAGSVEVVPLHERLGLTLRVYVKDISDHLPVMARFQTAQDDD